MKNILITGGTSGLGLAMANALAGENYMIFAVGRRIPEVRTQTNPEFIYIDITDNSCIEIAIKSIIEKHRTIDVLINCAGFGVAASIEEIPMENIRQAFEVNLFGTIRMIKAVVPYMRNQKSGLIVNTSSIGGQTGLPFQGVYSSTKFALEGLTEALRIELKPFGINVCIIEPGDYSTQIAVNRMVIKPAENSPYYHRLNGFFDLLNQKIRSGSNPDKIGKLIVHIVRSKNPKLRYRSGRTMEKLTPFFQRLIPSRQFEKLISGFYRL